MPQQDYSLEDGYFNNASSSRESSKRINHILKKSSIKEGLEQLTVLSQADQKQKRKVAPELNELALNDLKVIKMRSAIDTKRFYKREKFKPGTKLQMGKVLDSPGDLYSSRIPKKQRKKTLIDELLADTAFKSNIKKRYVEIINSKSCGNKRRAKRFKLKVDKETVIPLRSRG